MPQMNKGGKFIFGKSIIRSDLTIQFPEQAIKEYHATAEGKIYLFTGSKITGGFCVTRKGLLEPSKLGHILWEPKDHCWKKQKIMTEKSQYIKKADRILINSDYL